MNELLSGLADVVPFHTVHLEEFLPELKSLIDFFHLPYDVTRLRTSADETELFSTVWREFRTIFKQQEQMKTFPWCDGTEAKGGQWGRKGPSMAVKVEASWVPFIQVSEQCSVVLRCRNPTYRLHICLSSVSVDFACR